MEITEKVVGAFRPWKKQEKTILMELPL